MTDMLHLKKLIGKILNSTPVGRVDMYAGSTAPTGWLLCNGSAVSRTTYAALFAVIGTTYGSGNGSTTFNLPDLRGRVPVGVGTGTATGATAHTLGQKAGAETHTLTEEQLPNISGTVDIRRYQTSAGSIGNTAHNASGHFSASTASDSTSFLKGAVAANGTTAVTFEFGSGAAHNNMQPYLGINFIIYAGGVIRNIIANICHFREGVAAC